MANESGPDLSLFLDILFKLEANEVPYVVIGGFAAALYGLTRSTFDIDIIVDLGEEHIRSITEAYQIPRYYADPNQMRQAMDALSLSCCPGGGQGVIANSSPTRGL